MLLAQCPQGFTGSSPVPSAKMSEVYKIVEPYEEGYKTLFRGTNGTRNLPFDEWLKADKRMVRDGSGGKLYLSGFHVFKSENDACNYIGRFRRPDRHIIKCLAKDLRKKPTNKIVWLADEILIPSNKRIIDKIIEDLKYLFNEVDAHIHNFEKYKVYKTFKSKIKKWENYE